MFVMYFFKLLFAFQYQCGHGTWHGTLMDGHAILCYVNNYNSNNRSKL